MAHWAEIDDDNFVVRVVVTPNDDPDEGHDWLVRNLGGRWLKTSYNTRAGVHTEGGTPFRGNFAGIGMLYNPELDAFIQQKPMDRETVFDPTTYQWVLVENETTEPLA